MMETGLCMRVAVVVVVGGGWDTPLSLTMGASEDCSKWPGTISYPAKIKKQYP